MRNLLRLISINFTLARFGLDEIVLSMHFYRPLYWLGKVNPFNWFRGNDRSQAVRLRLCIESLGPIFIKFGQMMSTRRDLFGDEIADELEKLLDRVPPFPGTRHAILSSSNWACRWSRRSANSMSVK